MKVNLSKKSLKEKIRFLKPKLNLLLIHLKVPIPSFTNTGYPSDYTIPW